MGLIDKGKSQYKKERKKKVLKEEISTSRKDQLEKKGTKYYGKKLDNDVSKNQLERETE